MIVNKNLEVVNQQKESAKIKTGCFDENQAFIYSTSTHFKYMFTEAKTNGTFKSVDEPYYVAFVRIYPSLISLIVYEKPSLCFQQIRRIEQY